MGLDGLEEAHDDPDVDGNDVESGLGKDGLGEDGHEERATDGPAAEDEDLKRVGVLGRL